MDPELDKQVEALAAEHRRLTEELARTAELSARVHDEAADVHEELAHPLLDPADLRAHAEADRRLAAVERSRLQDDAPPGQDG